MAIEIKGIPVLKNSEANQFEKHVQTAMSKRSTVSFGEHIRMKDAILKKAKPFIIS